MIAGGIWVAFFGACQRDERRGQDKSLKVPQFWMLWSVVCLNGIAGVSVLSTGKDIMQEVFGNA